MISRACTCNLRLWWRRLARQLKLELWLCMPYSISICARIITFALQTPYQVLQTPNTLDHTLSTPQRLSLNTLDHTSSTQSLSPNTLGHTSSTPQRLRRPVPKFPPSYTVLR